MRCSEIRQCPLCGQWLCRRGCHTPRDQIRFGTDLVCRRQTSIRSTNRTMTTSFLDSLESGTRGWSGLHRTTARLGHSWQCLRLQQCPIHLCTETLSPQNSRSRKCPRSLLRIPVDRMLFAVIGRTKIRQCEHFIVIDVFRGCHSNGSTFLGKS